jgi:undecaprenyl-diphosphatase
LLLAGDGISWVQAGVIGLVEGLTEFLPVSSTAHMAVVPQLLRWPDPGAAFSAIVQIGPIAAIIAYFREDLRQFVRGILRTRTPFRIPTEDTEARLGWYALLASLPVLFMGKLLEDYIEGPFRSLYVIAGAFIVYGIVLWIAEKVGKRTRNLEEMNFRQSQIVGWMQCLALIPGVSRSGATISAALFQGFSHESAARFAFLLSIPPLAAAGLYELYKDVIKTGGSLSVGPMLFGMLVAAVSAYLVIDWFLRIVKKFGTAPFIVYRIVAGILILILLRTGALKDAPPHASASSSPDVAHTLARAEPPVPPAQAMR